MKKEDYSDITIIIPIFNEGSNISELLKLIEKSYKNINIIVSDDGSGDRTQEIIQKSERNHRQNI